MWVGGSKICIFAPPDPHRFLATLGMITTSVIADPLLRYRDRFPFLKRTTYLVSHSLRAMPEARSRSTRTRGPRGACGRGGTGGG